MSTTTAAKGAVGSGIESRLLKEAYGTGAWHGPDLKAALSDVTPELAYWRPAAGRHNIAEIALHHAFCVNSVQSKISGRPAEPFVLEGEDWFDVPNKATLAWPKILATVDAAHRRLTALVTDVETGKTRSPLGDTERRDIVLGITCHAIYHAGQIQLVKRLAATA